MQRINAEPVKTCPRCGGRVRRVLHPVGIIFKGSGFYKTDYREATPPKPKRAKEPKKEKKETEGKPESKSAAS